MGRQSTKTKRPLSAAQRKAIAYMWAANVLRSFGQDSFIGMGMTEAEEADIVRRVHKLGDFICETKKSASLSKIIEHVKVNVK